MELKKFITRLLYFSIAIAGVFTAAVILFSPGGDVVSNGIATTFLILLADGIIIVGLFARHNWLKIVTWAMAIYSLVVAVVYTWLPTPIYSYRSNMHGQTSPMTSHQESLRESFADLTFGGYIIAFALVGLSLFSLLDKVIEENKTTVTNYAYKTTLALGLSSGLALSIAASISNTGLIMRAGFSLLFLAFTSAVIMAIALVSNNIQKSRAEMQERLKNPQQQQLQQGQNPYYNQQGYPQGVPQNNGWQYPEPSQYRPGYPATQEYPQATQNNLNETPAPQTPPQKDGENNNLKNPE